MLTENNAKLNNRVLKEIKEKNISVYDRDGNELDSTTINGLTKAHVTMSRAMPYSYEALWNVVNDKEIKEYIAKDNKHFYTIELGFNEYIELALGSKKNNYQKQYLIDELKKAKIDNKVIKVRDKYIFAPPIFFVLEARLKKRISNLNNSEYYKTDSITIFFLKALFEEIVEKNNYSFFLVPKNMYSDTKRLLEHLCILHNGNNMIKDDSIFSSLMTSSKCQKTIYYLLTKNNRSSKVRKKKDGTEVAAPTIMGLNLFDFARYVYPEYVRPNTNRETLRNRDKLIANIRASILIYNTLLVQNKISNSTLLLNFSDIFDSGRTNTSEDIIIPIVRLEDIENSIFSMLSLTFYNNLAYNFDLTKTVIFERTQNKAKLKKALANLNKALLNIFSQNIQSNQAKPELNKELLSLNITNTINAHNIRKLMRDLLKHL